MISKRCKEDTLEQRGTHERQATGCQEAASDLCKAQVTLRKLATGLTLSTWSRQLVSAAAMPRWMMRVAMVRSRVQVVQLASAAASP